MPTYEYTCEACGNDWEAEQRISEPALKDCPKCGAPKAKRLISGGNFMLKGGGWYADGYGNKPSKSSSSSSESKPSESKSDGKSESKSDKAESKSETKSSDSSSTPASTSTPSTPSSKD